jgi:hypothetical protein
MSLLRIPVRQETSTFQIQATNLRRVRAGSADGLFEMAGAGTATDQDPIKPLLAGASGKLANIDLGIASETKDGRGGGENQPFGIDGKGPAAITEK